LKKTHCFLIDLNVDYFKVLVFHFMVQFFKFYYEVCFVFVSLQYFDAVGWLRGKPGKILFQQLQKVYLLRTRHNVE